MKHLGLGSKPGPAVLLCLISAAACTESPDPSGPDEVPSLSPGAGASASAQFRGRYVIRFAEDLEQQKVETTDMLELEDGSTVELRFRGNRPDIHPGQHLKVRGDRRGGSLEVEDGSVEADSPLASIMASAAVTATKRVAIVLINFSNNTTQPYTPAYAAAVAFTNSNSVAAYYQSNSWNGVTLVGDVYGWFTIPDANTACNYSTWAGSANAAAAAAGIDLSSAKYENVVYAFPSTPACGWSGLGNLPGRTSWANGTSAMSLRVVGHELGHNFGTHHASTYSCTEAGVRVSLSTTAANCTTSEYGDPFSIMGNTTRRHTNRSLTNFTWLSGSSRQDVVQSGDYRLSPLYAAGGVQMIRVQRSSSSFLTLEFRVPAGPFDGFSATDPVVNGVTLRLTGTDAIRSQSQLIDATPATTGFGDAPLTVGKTFVDPLTGVSVTTLAVSPTGADVRISFAPVPPDEAAPSQPGNFRATPLDPNRISLSWAASTDNVAVSGYRVFRGGVQVGTATGTGYTDGGLAPSTSYTYQVLAYDASGNTSGAATASATTPTPDGVAPSAPTNLTGSVGKGKKVTLSWKASTDNVGVAGYRVFQNGNLISTVTGTSFTGPLPGGKNPSATYHVVSFDAAGNVSAASNTVQIGG